MCKCLFNVTITSTSDRKYCQGLKLEWHVTVCTPIPWSPQHHCEIYVTFNIHTLLTNTLTGETYHNTVTVTSDSHSHARCGCGHFRSCVSARDDGVT